MLDRILLLQDTEQCTLCKIFLVYRIRFNGVSTWYKQ